MNHPGKLALLAVILAGGIAAQDRAGPADWLANVTLTATATASHVDNLSRTSAVAFRKDAETYELGLGATGHRQLAPAWLGHAGLEATLFTAPDYTLTNHVTAGPRLGLQYKFGLGPLAPTLQVDLALPYKAARLDADRGWGAEVGVRLSKRFTPEFRAGFAAQWTEHDARSQTFDLDQHSYSLEATWDFAGQWSLSGSAGRLSGDIVANAEWNVWAQALSGGFGPKVQAYYTARPWSVTNLYGAGWVSYNVEADVDLWSLALGFRATERTTLELAYRSFHVVNKVGVTYPVGSWGLSASHRF